MTVENLRHSARDTNAVTAAASGGVFRHPRRGAWLAGQPPNRALASQRFGIDVGRVYLRLDIDGGPLIADCATIDAHDWFTTTLACAMCFVRNLRALTRAFDVAASDVASAEANVDP